jgi:hypothetical protein
MSKTLLNIKNNHIDNCGEPPVINTKENYAGYFANRYGEQWIYTYHYDTKKKTLRGGDIGWGEELEVTINKDGTVSHGCHMNTEEYRWLLSCVETTKYFEGNT